MSTQPATNLLGQLVQIDHRLKKTRDEFRDSFSRCVNAGYTDTEIARQLGITPEAVRVRRRRLDLPTATEVAAGMDLDPD